MKRGKQRPGRAHPTPALARAEAHARRPGLEVLEPALRNATPIIEVKPRRVGGATYQVPVEIRGDRRMSLGVRWLVQAARKRSGKSMSEKLAGELVDAMNSLGARGQAPRRHAQDGRGQQGLQPLQVVVPGATQGARHSGATGSPRAHAQHRDHRAHRRRQDDRDRAHPLLHQEDLQDRRGPRGRRHDGLDAPGAGARHHHHRRGDDRVLGRPSHQHHRYARARGLHRRGRAQPARARRRGRRLRRRGRRRAAVGDGLAPGRPLRRAAHLLHQQARPHRRRLLALRRLDQGPPRRATPCRSRSRSAARTSSRASSTSIEHEGDLYRDDLGEEIDRGEIPAELLRRGREAPPRRWSRPSPRSTTS